MRAIVIEKFVESAGLPTPRSLAASLTDSPSGSTSALIYPPG